MCEYHNILKEYWGYDEFRPLQEDIVKSVIEGNDTLALMPTGGGKSITFQVPALALDGICLVITPLIALMKDQVENLKRREIKALAIHSGMTREEINIALDNCVFGGYKFLYLSPERLGTELFRVRVQQMNVNLVAIDEAHCISQWGYDFRPSYLKIALLRKLIPEVPFLALTATATPTVAKDIMEKLEFRKDHILKKSFTRENLVYVVRKTEDKYGELVRIVKKIPGSGVIYVRNRRKTKEIADLLTKCGIKAGHYHAGLKYESRMEKQDAWGRNSIHVIVATNAFGMGIDKSDVRFVIHVDLPDSPEAYFQEAGRAGRDGKPAYAILLFSPADEKLAEKRTDVNFPGFETIREVYRSLFNFLQVPIGAGKGSSHDFILGEFLSKYRFNAMIATSALKILAMEGYIEITDEINNPSRIMFLIRRDDLYKFQIKNPDFDGFIKLLLRSYSGIFSQYVGFDEYTLTRRAGMTHEEVYNYLKKLSSMRVIHYIPKKQNPVVTLLEERLEDKNIHISPGIYRFRKERYIEKMSTLLDYANNETICRSRFLLAYFGEKDAAPCGKCDVCLAARMKALSGDEIKQYREKILTKLKERPSDLNEIRDLLELESEKISLLMEGLLEKGDILRRPDLKFEIKEK